MDENNTNDSVNQKSGEQPQVNQQLLSSPIKSSNLLSKKQIFFSRSFLLYFAVVVIIFGFWVLPSFGITILPSMVQYIIETPDRSSFQKIFDSIELPTNFKLIDSQFGHDADQEHLSLLRQYAVHGTREDIIKELEPELDRSGFNLTKSVKDDGINLDFYEVGNNNNNDPTLFIHLLPQDDPNTGITSDSGNKEVTEVNILLGY